MALKEVKFTSLITWKVYEKNAYIASNGNSDTNVSNIDMEFHID
jgi:hypothetical protein